LELLTDVGAQCVLDSENCKVMGVVMNMVMLLVSRSGHLFFDGSTKVFGSFILGLSVGF
jgi:hypothetical protein